MKEEQENMQE
jgi:hypothetical protein